MSDPQQIPASVVVARVDGGIELTLLDASAGAIGAPERIGTADLAVRVALLERDRPRWVWNTTAVYPTVLAADQRVERAHDLRLARAILRRASATAAAFAGVPEDGWDAESAGEDSGALFEIAGHVPDAVAEFRRQLAAVDGGAAPSRMRLLIAAESAGALAAAEMRHVGMPWRSAVHAAVLERALGPRVAPGTRPEAMERLLARIRDALDAPRLNPDSPPELVKALRRAGLTVETTRSHELKALDHPAIAPLLEYKKLSRLFTANGWHWLDSWVVDDRFHPEYVVGGVVTGRWATRGAGAMQLPKELRVAVVADPGWRLVVADAAQLEPRVLAGMAHDIAMADAGRGRDLYEGIVATGAVPDRRSAKYGVLGALYGATSGPGGLLVPRLERRFPKALGLVDAAAREGERGGVVTTLLGRTSPAPSDAWASAQSAAGADGADAAVTRRGRSWARDQGRFTRNFVVQGTAAEWALCWMADLRQRLAAFGDGPPSARPQLVYFLHDEIVVHTPAAFADQVADAVRSAAEKAGRILFGDFPVDFPLDLAIVDCYADAA